MAQFSGSPGPIPDPSILEGVTVPPFVRLPEPQSLFKVRAERFDLLARNSDLAPYLTFLRDICAAQHAVQTGLPEPEMPTAEAVARARAAEMPPLDRSHFTADTAFDSTFERFLAAAAPIRKPPAAAEALARVAAATPDQRDTLVRTVLADTIPPEALADHIYVAAALQVHFARLAARLDGEALVPVGDAVCPSCGGRPVASLIVNWPNAHGARYCACALCGTWWNYVRIRCIACGTTKGIAYQEPEGGQGAIKAETCDVCQSYCKVLYLPVAHDMEPVADDVASLGLDLLMQDGPYRRAAVNPFLLGY